MIVLQIWLVIMVAFIVCGSLFLIGVTVREFYRMWRDGEL